MVDDDTNSAVNPLSMSDEEFMEAVAKGSFEAPAGDAAPDQGAADAVVEGAVEQPVIPEPAAPVEQPAQGEGAAVTEEQGGETGAAKEQPKESDPKEPATEPKEGDVPAEPKDEAPVVDYKAGYEMLLAPFKANGKTIQAKSPEEALKLMQMGANYTRKMQELQPAKKLLMMAESHGIDESKLSYLIDLDKKDPEAIKRLIKDSGIDPLELDLNTTNYQPTDKSVSDTEVQFQDALDNLRAQEGGQEFLQSIHSNWDPVSKSVLYEKPEILETLSAQKANGIYDRISDEIAHRKTMGLIGSAVPFFQAYTQVGDDLAKAGKFDDLIEAAKPKPVQPVAPVERQVVATSVAKPKPPVQDDQAAKAAATARTTAKTAKPFINPLAMSDEEFLKTMKV